MAKKKTIIQVYEIQDPREAEILGALGIDHIGSVLLSKEEWKIQSIKDVVHIAKEGGSKSTIIPLFNDRNVLCRLIDYYEPNILHFCEMLPQGDAGTIERMRLCELQYQLKTRYPQLLVMRSIPIPQSGKAFDYPFMEIAREFEIVSDFFLTDTLIVEGSAADDLQPVHGFVGITGKTCDWDMAASLVCGSSIPVILAGGLTPENVHEALVRVQPHGVDTCTGTNEVDSSGKPVRFKKDISRLKKFINEVRSLI